MTTDEILVNSGLTETRVALIGGGRVQEVFIEREGERSLVGDIFLGHVSRVAGGVDAAFVDIGAERGGFLPAAEARYAAGARDADAPPPRIAQCVHEGEAVLVQVQRDAAGSKGARLTTRLTLPGRLLVFGPRQEGVAVSRRLGEADERARLAGLVEGLVEEGEGFVLRTAAAGAGGEALAAEASRLRALWREIEERAAAAEAPAPLHREIGAVERALRDHGGEGLRAVRFDSGNALAAARRYCAAFAPHLTDRLDHVTGPGALFDLHDAEAEIASILERRVALPSGGSLSIESTEALTAIDVNSGSAIDGASQRDVALRANLEAAAETARQLRLRAIGGLVIVDFMQLRQRDDMAEVMAALKGALADDPAPVRAAGPSEFGLAEIARKRVRAPLLDVLTETCGHCGQGRRKRVATVLAEVLRRAPREAMAGPGGALHIAAAPEIVARLEADQGALVAELERRTGRAVECVAEPAYDRARFDVRVA